MERRRFLTELVGLAAVPVAGSLLVRLVAGHSPAGRLGGSLLSGPGRIAAGPVPAAGGAVQALKKSKSAWKKLLTDEQYAVLFEGATERAGSSPLDRLYSPGTYICAACYLPLFDSKTKFDSGTGWPSFWAVMDGRVAYQRDFKLVVPRTEYHCARCGGHQGHVFDDGPPPTGNRYCNNGVALRFVPAGQALPALRT